MRAGRELPFPESQASIDFTVTKAPTRQKLRRQRRMGYPPPHPLEAKADVVVSAIKNRTLDYYKRRRVGRVCVGRSRASADGIVPCAQGMCSRVGKAALSLSSRFAVTKWMWISSSTEDWYSAANCQWISALPRTASNWSATSD